MEPEGRQGESTDVFAETSTDSRSSRLKATRSSHGASCPWMAVLARKKCVSHRCSGRSEPKLTATEGFCVAFTRALKSYSWSTDLFSNIVSLSTSDVAVVNERPALQQHNPDQGGQLANLKFALGEAAKQAYMQSKQDPQLIVVILPVSRDMVINKHGLIHRSAKSWPFTKSSRSWPSRPLSE